MKQKNLWLIGGGFLAILIWTLLIFHVVYPLLIAEVNIYGGIVFTPIGYFVTSCVLSPIWEEAVFRHAPLQITHKLKERFKFDITIPIILLSSIIFGIVHGNGNMSIIM